MRRDKTTNHCELWNAIKGEAYFFGREEVPNGVLCFRTKPGVNMNIRTYDSKCPLTSVGCVITDENCYSNIQKFEDPSMIDFNLDSPKLWKPLFDQKYFEQNPEM